MQHLRMDPYLNTPGVDSFHRGFHQAKDRIRTVEIRAEAPAAIRQAARPPQPAAETARNR
jgi:hypothetical protein